MIHLDDKIRRPLVGRQACGLVMFFYSLSFCSSCFSLCPPPVVLPQGFGCVHSSTLADPSPIPCRCLGGWRAGRKIIKFQACPQDPKKSEKVTPGSPKVTKMTPKTPPGAPIYWKSLKSETIEKPQYLLWFKHIQPPQSGHIPSQNH